MTDYSAKTVVHKYFRALILSGVYGFEEYFRRGEYSTVEELQEDYRRGKVLIFTAAETSANFNAAGILSRIPDLCGCTKKEFIDEVENYIGDTLAGEPEILEKMSFCDEIPGACELMTFIVALHWDSYYTDKEPITAKDIMQDNSPDMERYLFDSYMTCRYGYVGYQLRLYDNCGRLTEKIFFSDMKSAVSEGNMQIGRYPGTYRRYTVMQSRWFMDTWYITAHGDNPCIMYPFPDLPVQWCTEFYRGHDTVCEVLTRRRKLREKTLQKIADKYDTYYYVLSCRRKGEKAFDTRYFDIQHAVEAGQYRERLDNMLPGNGPKGFANMYYNIHRKDITQIVDAIEHEIIRFSKRQ